MELLNSIFLPMLAGHLVADFWLQPNSWIVHKKANGIKSSKLLVHVLIASILPVVFIFQLNLWWFVPVIFVTHLIMDLFKMRLKDNVPAFLSDQLFHILILWVLATYATKIEITKNVAIVWIYATGFLLVTNPAGIFIGKFLNLVIPNKNKTAKTESVSGWIGILERILIFIFIMVDQFSAIGFLIAAKSVFRFNDAREEDNKKAGYFLLGTLISFALAIIISLIVNKCVMLLKSSF